MTVSVSRRALAGFAAVVVAAGLAVGAESKSDLQRALRDESISPGWIYDDIDAGFAKAAKDKRPLCVVFR